MIGIYFSGTGNTKYCIEKFLSVYDNTVSSLSIEDPAIIDQISKHQDIVLAYPIYYTDTPTAKARWVLMYIHFQIYSKAYKTDEFP